MLVRPLLVLAAAALAFLPHRAAAQPGPPGGEQTAAPVRPWLSGGLGYGHAGAGPSTDAGGHLSGRLGVHAVVGRTRITARLTATTGGPSDYTAGSFTLGTAFVHDEFYDAGLLVGYDIPLGGRWRASGSAGVAAVWGTRAARSGCFGFCFGGSGRREAFPPRLGVPLELDVSARVSGGLRLGLLGYANVNAEEVFGGGLLTASIRL